MLHPDGSLLATGGADCYLSLSQWGGALSPAEGAAEKVVRDAARVRCDGPVITVAFASEGMGSKLTVVAAG